MGLADWSQKWFPDAFVFALVGLFIVFVAGLFAGVGTRNLIKYFGDGFWGLIPFTMQMAMIIIGGFVVATSPPVHKLIKKLAKVPRTPRGAVAFVVFFSTHTTRSTTETFGVGTRMAKPSTCARCANDTTS